MDCTISSLVTFLQENLRFFSLPCQDNELLSCINRSLPVTSPFTDLDAFWPIHQSGKRHSHHHWNFVKDTHWSFVTTVTLRKAFNEPDVTVICSDYRACPWSVLLQQQPSQTLASNHSLHQLLPLQFLGDGWGVLLKEGRKQEAVSIIKHRSVWYQASLDLFFMQEPVYIVNANCDNWWDEVG